MLNYIWGFLIVIGIVYGAVTGNLEGITNGALDSAKEAVTLCITMLGVMSLWTGLMEVARRSGIIAACTKGIGPVLRWMFPDVPGNHRAMEYITTNVIANFFGLGWAATPAGIKAMEELGKLNVEVNGKEHESIATNAMCTFLVINISSLQLIPVNIIAYRSQYGSANPAAVIMPGIIATFVSTLAGIIFCRIMYHRKRAL